MNPALLALIVLYFVLGLKHHRDTLYGHPLYIFEPDNQLATPLLMTEKALVYQSTIQFRPAEATGTCVESEPFALQVKGSSMAPEFIDGCVVVVDPSVTPAHGAFVIADCGPHGYLLRQLLIDADSWTLSTLNNSAQPADPPGQIKMAPDKDAILGTVVQQSRRNRTFKRY